MAVVLNAGDNSCVFIDGLPYQRGSILPVFEEQLNKERPDRNNSEYVSLRRVSSIRNDDFTGSLHYSEYYDESTGLAFASFNDLVNWLAANMFAGNISGGGSGVSFSKRFNIVAVPVAPNDKAPGATFSDPWLVGKTITLMMLNKAAYDDGDITFNGGTGTVGVIGYSFQAGDRIIIFTT